MLAWLLWPLVFCYIVTIPRMPIQLLQTQHGRMSQMQGASPMLAFLHADVDSKKSDIGSRDRVCLGTGGSRYIKANDYSQAGQSRAVVSL